MHKLRSYFRGSLQQRLIFLLEILLNFGKYFVVNNGNILKRVINSLSFGTQNIRFPSMRIQSRIISGACAMK
jgi:hypothetical protein